MSIEPFNRLVKLAARAFYDDITKGDNPSKNTRSDNRGIAVVVLDALTRRQWVREEDLAKDLKLQTKQLRRTLRFFEQEKLIAVDHRKETAKSAKIYNSAFNDNNNYYVHSANGNGNGSSINNGGNGMGDDKVKMHTHSYCCLDYAQIHDVVRYRLHRMRKYLRDQLDDKNKIQEYLCSDCGKKYNALDVSRLISMEDMNFHCERCNAELVAEMDNAGEGAGEGDDNARKRSREKYNDMLNRMEVQLKPLVEQLNRVKDLAVPELGSLQAWEARALAAARAANGGSGGDPRANQGFGTRMPFVGEPKIEVAISGVDDTGGSIAAQNGNEPIKVLPPWMIKQGMKLTKEQLGELKEEPMDGSLDPLGSSDDKKKAVTEPEDSKHVQEEFMKAYYAAYIKREQETTVAASDAHLSSTERLVGEKSKRGDNDDGEDVEWEEEAPVDENTSGNFKVDLNVEAGVSEEEDEDDIDWEEG
ncbi:general transcription factor [Lithospermum erythrorhizon]|uniref:General transcription factor n=1 Tax=Lithospermum erythrorhizon TaxID=34254 RepID=A0AAV3P8W4_LITER